MIPVADPSSVAQLSLHWGAPLLSAALKGSLFVGLLLLAGRMMRSCSASARHLLWALGTIGLLLMPVLEAGLPAWRVFPVPAALFFAADSTPIPPEVSATSTLAGAREAGTFHASQNAPAAASPAVRWLAVWLMGALPLAFALAWGMIRLRRLRREARPLMTDEWPALLSAVCDDLGVDTPPALLVSPRRLAPMAWGLRRAIVLLPVGCGDWSEELRRQVLLHELAHVRRRDCLSQLAAQCACLIHWFNPLVWMVARRMRIERERACDDLVLAAGVRPSAYAGHLLQIARSLGAQEGVLSPELALAPRSGLYDRLDAVLAVGLRRGSPSGRAAAAAAALILACAVGSSVLAPMARADGRKSAQRAAESRAEEGERMCEALAARLGALEASLADDEEALARQPAVDYEEALARLRDDEERARALIALTRQAENEVRLREARLRGSR